MPYPGCPGKVAVKRVFLVKIQRNVCFSLDSTSIKFDGRISLDLLGKITGNVRSVIGASTPLCLTTFLYRCWCCTIESVNCRVIELFVKCTCDSTEYVLYYYTSRVDIGGF